MSGKEPVVVTVKKPIKAEVSTEPFQPYDTWKSEYEPAADDSSTAATTIKTTAPSTSPKATNALEELLNGLTDKLVLTLLDMSCQLIEQVEESLDKGADADFCDNDNKASIDHQLANAAKGYLLTHRFEKQPYHGRKLYDMRQSAIERLAALLEQQLQRSSLRLRQETMRAALQSMPPIKDLIQYEWEELIRNYLVLEKEKEEVINNKNNKNKNKNNDGGKENSGPSSTVWDSDTLAILEIAGVSPPPTKTTNDDDDDDDDDTRQVGNQLLGNHLLVAFKVSFDEKLEDFHLHLSHTMDSILCDYALAKFMPDVANTKKQVKATDMLAAILDKHRLRLTDTVRTEISSMVHVLEALMTRKERPYVLNNSMGLGSISPLAIRDRISSNTKSSNKYFF